MTDVILGHSLGPDCAPCGDGRSGTSCVHSSYSQRYLRFVLEHKEAFEAAYLDGNPQAARNEMERLEREYATMLPRHNCTCNPSHCHECQKLGRHRLGVCVVCLKLPVLQRPKSCFECARLKDGATAQEIGRSSPVNPPMPLVLMLDVNSGYAA